MYVGVILMASKDDMKDFSIPHVCGGDPEMNDTIVVYEFVFPMYVGVILDWLVKRLYR